MKKLRGIISRYSKSSKDLEVFRYQSITERKSPVMLLIEFFEKKQKIKFHHEVQ